MEREALGCAGHMMLTLFRMLAVCSVAGGVFFMRGKENQGVDGKKGYIYSSSCDLVAILCSVG
jgi:hypothetical protein